MAGPVGSPFLTLLLLQACTLLAGRGAHSPIQAFLNCRVGVYMTAQAPTARHQENYA